jgi:hypothetical protein
LPLIGQSPDDRTSPAESSSSRHQASTYCVNARVTPDYASQWRRKVRCYHFANLTKSAALTLLTTPQLPQAKTCADRIFHIAKSRTIMVRLISMAMTGYYRTMQRPRAHQPLSMLKYDPIGTTSSYLPNTRGGGVAASRIIVGCAR